MASLKPPVERTLLVAKVSVSVKYLGVETDLSANEFAGGVISAQGFVHLESFAVSDGIPTWRYAVQDALLEQGIFMAHGANTSYLRLELMRASAPLRVTLKPLITYRGYHSHGRGAKSFRLEAGDAECRVSAFDGARAYRLSISRGCYAASPEWYWNYWHRIEEERGLDALEDLLTPGTFTVELSPGLPVYLIATAEIAAPAAGAEVQGALTAASRRLTAAVPKRAPAWIRTLAQASDQFIVRRSEAGAAAMAGAASSSIIAGYPWVADWGRDTMVSLPGLATSLRRHDLAAGILRTYARFVDRGMLPNCFPDAGDAVPQYNTADAALWMFQALDSYLHARGDPALARALFPTLMAIIHAHSDGTRYGICVDPADALLRAGETGTQLTWMD